GGPATTVPTDAEATDLTPSDPLLNRRRRQTACRLIHTPKPFSVPTFSRPSKRVLGPLRFRPGLLEMIAQAAAGSIATSVICDQVCADVREMTHDRCVRKR